MRSLVAIIVLLISSALSPPVNAQGYSGDLPTYNRSSYSSYYQGRLGRARFEVDVYNYSARRYRDRYRGRGSYGSSYYNRTRSGFGYSYGVDRRGGWFFYSY